MRDTNKQLVMSQNRKHTKIIVTPKIVRSIDDDPIEYRPDRYFAALKKNDVVAVVVVRCSMFAVVVDTFTANERERERERVKINLRVIRNCLA